MRPELWRIGAGKKHPKEIIKRGKNNVRSRFCNSKRKIKILSN